MLKEALRRLLWLAPTLIVVTVPTFWALSRATSEATSATPELPLFLNTNPLGAKERALAALGRIAENGPDAEAAQRELFALGGAALPHVLPQFDALEPGARRRVALALVPVAKRMGVGSTNDFESPESAILFFSRYWEEHAIDFRPAVVRRAVRRFAEHPSALRRAEVVELDTYALPDLIEAMRPIHDAADVARVRHVVDLAARVTSKDWRIPANASRDAAVSVVGTWDDYWLDHRSDFVAFTGTSRLAATLRETRYGRWVERTLRGGLGTLKDGRSVREALRERGTTTLWLLMLAVLVGYPAGGVAGALAALHHRRPRGTAMLGLAAAVSGVTMVGTAAWLSLGAARPFGAVSAGAAMVLGTAAFAFFPFRNAVNDVAERVWLRTERAIGVPPFASAIRSLRYAGARFVALAFSDFPGILTSAFVLERAFSLRGIGELTVSAVKNGDLAWLMSFAFLGTLATGVLQIASDMILAMLDPRVIFPADRVRRARS